LAVPKDPKDGTLVEGRPLAGDEWADATTEAIRQNDVEVRVEAVKIGRLPDKGATSFFLVYLRLCNVASGQPIPLGGFTPDTQRPTLADDAGSPFAFQEYRVRKVARVVTYAVPGSETIELSQNQ